MSPCHSLSCSLIFLLGLLPAAPTSAAPFRPTSDAEVIERLPGRLVGTEQQALRELRSRLTESPGNPVVAAELAERYYRLAQRSGDPRYIGYAQSVIAPWPAGSEAPPSIRTVRALIAQFLHDFDGALNDLGAVLQAAPGDTAARSYRAIIYLVKADYAAALADCRELESRLRGLVAGACRPTVEAVAGQAEPAITTLRRLLETYPAAPANEKLWVLTRLAEISQRLGRPAEADRYYGQALALGIVDQYLLATYAEFLLDRKRPAEVVKLLADQTLNDVLLLRLALAEKALGLPAAETHRAMLADRYEASRRRGDKLHLADEALFALHFGADPVTAVRLARENWDLMQREPGDARILLESALTARNARAAEPVLIWLRSSGHQDASLHALAEQLRQLGAAGGEKR